MKVEVTEDEKYQLDILRLTTKLAELDKNLAISYMYQPSWLPDHYIGITQFDDKSQTVWNLHCHGQSDAKDCYDCVIEDLKKKDIIV